MSGSSADASFPANPLPSSAAAPIKPSSRCGPNELLLWLPDKLPHKPRDRPFHLFPGPRSARFL